MASRGFLIRFIDIGLIVLFGFVMLSDIDVLSQVEMSTADDAPQEDVVLERAVVSVTIGADGVFTVSDVETGSVLAPAIGSVDSLENVLRQVRDAAGAGIETIVLIQPDDNSIVQHTVDVMDICDRLGIAKSLQTATPESA